MYFRKIDIYTIDVHTVIKAMEDSRMDYEQKEILSKSNNLSKASPLA